MAKMTLTQITEKLEAANVKGSIYNVEMTDIKFRLGNIIWHDEALQAAVRKVQDVFEPRRNELKVYEDLCYIPVSNSHDLLNAVNAINRGVAKAENSSNEAIVNFFTVAEPLIHASELLKNLKTKVIKGRIPAETPNENARTLENTGTCGCCNRNVKLTSSSRIWDHGFQILNRGYGIGAGYKIGGSCFGVGYEPIEVSPLVWQDMLAAWEKRVVELPSIIENLTNILATMTKPERKMDFQRTPEERELAKEYTGRQDGLRQCKSELAYLTIRIPEMKEAIQNWSPRPLPMTK